MMGLPCCCWDVLPTRSLGPKILPGKAVLTKQPRRLREGTACQLLWEIYVR